MIITRRDRHGESSNSASPGNHVSLQEWIERWRTGVTLLSVAAGTWTHAGYIY
jgi:hypothetical protein